LTSRCDSCMLAKWYRYYCVRRLPPRGRFAACRALLRPRTKAPQTRLRKLGARREPTVRRRFHPTISTLGPAEETDMVSRQTRWTRKQYAEVPGYREKRSAHHRAYWAVVKDERNARRRVQPGAAFLRRYRMSLHDFDTLLVRQGGLCAACKTRRVCCVDHCHATGKVRGLLCMNCNLGIGHFNDDPDLMRSATAYLEASLCDPIAMSSGVTDAGHQPTGAQLTLPFESGCSKLAPTRRSGRRSDRGCRERAGRGVAARPLRSQS